MMVLTVSATINASHSSWRSDQYPMAPTHAGIRKSGIYGNNAVEVVDKGFGVFPFISKYRNNMPIPITAPGNGSPN